eukprot:Gregarina_sp_Pseudo_9__1173@NODE_1771_length_1341_cov_27_324885_g1640_i0_p1_GENE_NODE_1771_length_1341_cov_27_324885_g1640_i0NODE_1771_length_1341_cov_27_324885_g1640_i0_p1_ORF_typecomplete_len379_score69_76SPC25/PF06703_11/1e09_NODE_1771_length_1341_cov_27_324885_g1640_i02041262
MRQRKPTSKTTEPLVNPDIQPILTTINNATFTPYVESVKCTSLYSETQLQKTCAEAVAESLNGLTDDDNMSLLREMHLQSNIGLILGVFQVVTGAACCLLPFKSTSHWVFVLLATNFFIGALITLFFDWFLSDGVVMTVDDSHLAGPKHRAAHGLTVLCHFDKQSKSVRFGLAPSLRISDALLLATRKAVKLLKTFHLFMYHVLWRVQTSGLAIAARQKDESLRMANVSPTLISEDEDGGCWHWVDTPGSIPVEQQFGCFSDVLKFSAQGKETCRKDSDGKQIAKTETAKEETAKEETTKSAETFVKGGHSGLILERPVTRYFDEKGLLLADALNKDLKSLLVKYYIMRLDA